MVQEHNVNHALCPRPLPCCCSIVVVVFESACFQPRPTRSPSPSLQPRRLLTTLLLSSPVQPCQTCCQWCGPGLGPSPSPSRPAALCRPVAASELRTFARPVRIPSSRATRDGFCPEAIGLRAAAQQDSTMGCVLVPATVPPRTFIQATRRGTEAVSQHCQSASPLESRSPLECESRNKLQMLFPRTPV